MSEDTNKYAEGALLMTRQQYAERIAFSIRKLDMLINDGVVPVIRFSQKCIRIPVAEADASVMRFCTGNRGGAKA